MLTVADVKADVARVLGGVDDGVFFSRLNNAVDILANESDWNPLLGYVDVCVNSDRMCTLPREVATPLAVAINGQPAQAHDWLWRYHLNGPGVEFPQTSAYHWVDGLPVPTHRDPPPTGLPLVCNLETSLDNNIAFRVYGYDVNGNWIRSVEGGQLVDGFLVPTQYGTQNSNPVAPNIRRITRVSKPVTKGWIQLFTKDGSTLTRIGQYAPDDTEPTYRRIMLSKPCCWARIAFKKAVQKLTKDSDIVPLHSAYAIVTMVKALKNLDEDRPEEFVKYKNIAVDFLKKKQIAIDVPSAPSIQVSDGNLIADKRDRIDW